MEKCFYNRKFRNDTIVNVLRILVHGCFIVLNGKVQGCLQNTRSTPSIVGISVLDTKIHPNISGFFLIRVS